MVKKIFYFSLSLFILVLIFLGAYNFAFKNNVNSPLATGETPKEKNDGILAVVGEEKISNVLNEAILGPVVSEAGIVFYYSLDDKSVKKASLEGKEKTVLMSNLPGEATRILFSANQNQALLLLKQVSGGMLWYLATLSTKSLTPLKPEMGRLAWDNLGEKIYYQYTDSATGIRSLNIANPDGGEWKKLADLGADDFFLASVPKSSLVSFWKRPNAENVSAIETVSAVGENRKMLYSGAFGSDYSWSPDGERLLISGSDNPKNDGFSLRILPAKGTAESLSLPTLISKTAWSKNSRTLYYTLPGALPEGALLPNDYFGKPFYTKDTFWKVDVTTGKKSRVIELKSNTRSFDATDLFLSPKEDFLYFTDRVDKKLYRIEL